MVHQIEAQIQLAENNFPANAKLSQHHANIAIGILNQNDPIVNDTTWSKQIAERNPMVAAEVTSALNSLKSARYYSIKTCFYYCEFRQYL